MLNKLSPNRHITDRTIPRLFFEVVCLRIGRLEAARGSGLSVIGDDDSLAIWIGFKECLVVGPQLRLQHEEWKISCL